MKAFQVRGPNEYGLEEVDTPKIKADEVLLRVKAVGICGSDLEVLDGTRPLTHVSYPIILGHEFSGEIVEIGPNVTGMKVGDHVTAEGVKRCDRCKNCLKGRTSTCLYYDEIGFTSNGAMAEFVAVPQRCLHRLPDDMPFEVGALSEPAAGAASAVHRANIEPGDTVVLIGAGSIGTLALQVAKLYSPERLIVIETDERKLEAARKLGATHTVNPKREDGRVLVMDLTQGAGADVVLECAGTLDSLSSTFSYVVKNAKIVVMGVAGGGRTIPLNSDYLVCNDILYQGVAGYSHQTFGWTQRLLASGFYDPDLIITHRFGLEQALDAFQTLRERRDTVIKVQIIP